MRAITVVKGRFEFLILPLNHQHPKYREGYRFELYLKDGMNYIGMGTYAPTTWVMQGEIDILIDFLNRKREIEIRKKMRIEK